MSGLMFSKKAEKKKRRRHPESILRQQEGTCYLCILLDDDWRRHTVLEEHHIFFSAHQRRLSEEYGLKVKLCLKHHRVGPMAVHQNQKIRRILEVEGQKAFEERYGRKKFLLVFGRNYL